MLAGIRQCALVPSDDGWQGGVFWPYDTGSFGSLMDEQKSQIEAHVLGSDSNTLGI